jgi:hypothetical protein
MPAKAQIFTSALPGRRDISPTPLSGPMRMFSRPCGSGMASSQAPGRRKLTNVTFLKKVTIINWQAKGFS